MKTLKEQFIKYVLEEAVKRPGSARPLRILDLGCGTACYAPILLEQFPDFEYVGVEPNIQSFAVAENNLAKIKNAKAHLQLGYDEIPNEEEKSFDLVFSLSALEHIKQLNRFIALGSKYAKKGALVVHRYDLGHALYPHSIKERIHVWFGNHIPSLLPERQFVRYVSLLEVKKAFGDNLLAPKQVTYHQMPNHKHFEKFFKESNTTAIDDLFAWEMKYQTDIKIIPEKEREKLFPAVAVWGEKFK